MQVAFQSLNQMAQKQQYDQENLRQQEVKYLQDQIA